MAKLQPQGVEPVVSFPRSVVMTPGHRPIVIVTRMTTTSRLFTEVIASLNMNDGRKLQALDSTSHSDRAGSQCQRPSPGLAHGRRSGTGWRGEGLRLCAFANPCGPLAFWQRTPVHSGAFVRAWLTFGFHRGRLCQRQSFGIG
jgi:hypothetical protein